MAEQEKTKEVSRDFSKVVLTLDNVLIPDEKIITTPSMEDGLDFEVETDLRIVGCEMIQTSGILLKLPQVAMATGQVLFQRFYFSKSFVRHPMETVAMACINVASKIEESPRRIRDVVNVFHHIKQVKSGKTISPLVLDQNYINSKNQVIKAERRILKELGFCVHVKHPHKIIVMYLQVLESHTNQKLAQMSWNYMNDSFRTEVFVRYKPEAIACACIYLAARKLQIPLPTSPAWYIIFGFGEDELKDISMSILKLYSRPKPNMDEIEKAVTECKKRHNDAKLKARAVTGNFTPNSNSRPATPSKVSPSPVNSSIKKLKTEGDHSDHSSFGSRLENHVSRKKRSRSRSRSHSSRSRSRSNGRSYSSHASRSPPSPHRSQSPVLKYAKKESRDKKSVSAKEDKEYRDPYDRDFHRESGRDRGHRRERSTADHNVTSTTGSSGGKHKRRRHTPPYSPTYNSPDHRSKGHKKYYKDKERERYRSHSRERDSDRHRASKKRNGHHRSSSRDHYRR